MVLDRTTVTYDITFHLHFDETFTPAVISAIKYLKETVIRINTDLDYVASVGTSSFPLNLTQAPFAFDILFENLQPLMVGVGYQITVSNNATNNQYNYYCY